MTIKTRKESDFGMENEIKDNPFLKRIISLDNKIAKKLGLVD
jgi:hypothetical protein